MTTKQRFRSKYRLLLRERDHPPAHLHLFGGGHDVLIDIMTLASVGDWPHGLRDEVLAYIESHRDELMKEWEKWNE